VTAQEAFTKMMKQEIAPALRRLGFKGSSQRYELPSETHWAIVGFQKFSWSDHDRVEFTLNITVVDRAEWARAREARPYLPVRPSANVGGGVGWERRVADLVPDHRNGDLSWAVSPDFPTEAVAGDVVTAIAEHVLPAIRRRIDRRPAPT
jgi:hypothetical protein